MDAFFSSVHIVDAMIAVLLAEALVLRLLLRRRGGAPPRGLFASFGAGLCLMLAIRFALSGGQGPGFAALLMVAGVAHVLDLRGRIRS